MSYILDALKKSERQRRSRNEPVFHRGGPGAGPGRGLVMLALTVVGLLVAAVALMYHRTDEVVPGAETVVPPAGSPAQVADAEKPAPPSPETAAPAPAAPVPVDLPTRTTSNAALGRATQVLDPDSIPFLSAMPPEFQRDLPPLVVNIHVYSPDPGQRILYLNHRQYQRGEAMDNGVQIMDITPDGVVLQYLGQTFKLPRPS